MGRASRAKADARTRRQTLARLKIRAPRPGDETALARLLLTVVPDLNTTADAMHFAEHLTGGFPERGAMGCATGAAWVADNGHGVVGTVIVAPPLQWLFSVRPSMPEQLAVHLSHRMMEAEYLAVDTRARGHRIGAALVEHMRQAMTDRGVRLLLGTVTPDNAGLLPYYRTMGFQVLAPGAPFGITDDSGVNLWRPADPGITQMWLPLHQDVIAIKKPTPYGIRPVIAGVIAT